jgi:glycine/D-amino acid oxidase-like deaminating enzyme
VGSGITGLTAAYLLTAAGKSVALFERGRCAQVDTGHTTAHLTMVTDERLLELVKRFGRDHPQAVWDAGLATIAQIDSNIRSPVRSNGWTRNNTLGRSDDRERRSGSAEAT